MHLLAGLAPQHTCCIRLSMLKKTCCPFILCTNLILFAMQHTHTCTKLLSPHTHLQAIVCWFCTGGVHTTNNQISTAHNDEESSRQQAPAKRVRYMGTSDPNQQTQDTAVSAAHAVHAEPGDSTSHSPQPTVAIAKCAIHWPCNVVAANHVTCGSEMFCKCRLGLYLFAAVS